MKDFNNFGDLYTLVYSKRGNDRLDEDDDNDAKVLASAGKKNIWSMIERDAHWILVPGKVAGALFYHVTEEAWKTAEEEYFFD